MPGSSAASDEDTTPLLRDDSREVDSDARIGSYRAASPGKHTRVQRARLLCQNFLTSKLSHYFVLTLVGLDVSCIFGDIFISLILCEKTEENTKAWEKARDLLGLASLVFSCLFMAELGVAVSAFGWSYFRSWFHCFDAAVIIVGFVVDVLLHGIIEEVASLIVVLRLWRFFKIVEEFSVGAQERMDALAAKVERLQMQNTELKKEIEALRRKNGEDMNGIENWDSRRGS